MINTYTSINDVLQNAFVVRPTKVNATAKVDPFEDEDEDEFDSELDEILEPSEMSDPFTEQEEEDEE